MQSVWNASYAVTCSADEPTEIVGVTIIARSIRRALTKALKHIDSDQFSNLDTGIVELDRNPAFHRQGDLTSLLDRICGSTTRTTYEGRMMALKFLKGIKVPVFIGSPRAKRSGDEQNVTIPFRIALDGNTVRSCPDFVKGAYNEIKDGADFVGLKKEIENIDMHIFNLPDRKTPNIKLPRLLLVKLAIKEVKNSQSDVSIVFSFQTVYPWDKVIWEYLGDHYQSDVWATFDPAQAELLDTDAEEEEDEDQGKLPDGEESDAQPD